MASVGSAAPLQGNRTGAFGRSAVIPVVTIDDPERAVGMARALVAGGLTAIEVTLRTPAALDCIRAIAREVPEALVGPVAFGLPVLEIAVGLALLTGVFVRTAALACAVLLVLFLIGIGSAWARGLQIDCGCFGGGGATADPAYPAEIARDVALLAVALALARWPRSRLALGGRLDPLPHSRSEPSRAR